MSFTTHTFYVYFFFFVFSAQRKAELKSVKIVLIFLKHRSLQTLLIAHYDIMRWHFLFFPFFLFFIFA